MSPSVSVRFICINKEEILGKFKRNVYRILKGNLKKNTFDITALKNIFMFVFGEWRRESQ